MVDLAQTVSEWKVRIHLASTPAPAPAPASAPAPAPATGRREQ